MESLKPFLRNLLREMFAYNQGYSFLRRHDVNDNNIEIDYVKGLKPPPPPFQRQESDEDDSSESDEDDDTGEEESDEQEKNGDVDNQNSENASNASDDSDEPPEGDGQGGGILGLIAGLSGGEDGQSDLGDLLATISGIVANLSGDGIDLNAVIASGFGLFVGLLSEGNENPGAVIGSYLLTSLDSITGGGAAADQEGGSDENGGNETTMSDSTGFIASLLMSLLGDMSKGSSAASSSTSGFSPTTASFSSVDPQDGNLKSYSEVRSFCNEHGICGIY
ncbi:unnamed protein product [Diatraea saccharalis]|uniref:Uncharacterized protein n=1 Tax=Diatraea saccharalis TaxID=40085 RepID=A0A9N9WHS8_9NEOP|nr:unnamed protein product [Diatraea saccharalis]